MIKIKDTERYTCEKCKRFLLAVTKEDYYEIGPNKGIISTTNNLTIKCHCGEIHKFEK